MSQHTHTHNPCITCASALCAACVLCLLEQHSRELVETNNFSFTCEGSECKYTPTIAPINRKYFYLHHCLLLFYSSLFLRWFNFWHIKNILAKRNSKSMWIVITSVICFLTLRKRNVWQFSSTFTSCLLLSFRCHSFVGFFFFRLFHCCYYYSRQTTLY